MGKRSTGVGEDKVGGGVSEVQEVTQCHELDSSLKQQSLGSWTEKTSVDNVTVFFVTDVCACFYLLHLSLLRSRSHVQHLLSGKDQFDPARKTSRCLTD